jgi:hypothetical protein
LLMARHGLRLHWVTFTKRSSRFSFSFIFLIPCDYGFDSSCDQRHEIRGPGQRIQKNEILPNKKGVSS